MELSNWLVLVSPSYTIAMIKELVLDSITLLQLPSLPVSGYIAQLRYVEKRREYQRAVMRAKAIYEEQSCMELEKVVNNPRSGGKW